jgi:hypothetical protein
MILHCSCPKKQTSECNDLCIAKIATADKYPALILIVPDGELSNYAFKLYNDLIDELGLTE